MTAPTLDLPHWEPGCWCTASIRLCESRIEWEGDHGTRYPEQWMYVLWRPTQRALPWQTPDGWGLTIGPPDAEVTEQVGPGARVYTLAPQECVWSAWLSIPLVCDRFEPWLTEALQTVQAAQRQREQEHYGALYGRRQDDFQKFLRQVTGLG